MLGHLHWEAEGWPGGAVGSRLIHARAGRALGSQSDLHVTRAGKRNLCVPGPGRPDPDPLLASSCRKLDRRAQSGACLRASLHVPQVLTFLCFLCGLS